MKQKAKNKKIAAIVACCAAGLLIIWGIVGMGHFFTNVMKVEGKNISSGLYLLKQLDAYSEAKTESGAANAKKVLSSRIDGQSGSAWIRAKAEKDCIKFIAVQKLCAERDITLTEEDLSSVKQMVDYYWQYMEPSYTANGISLQTWRRSLANASLEGHLFDSMYAKDGEKAPTDEQIKTRYAEEYAHIRSLSVPLTTKEDKPYETPAEIDDMVAEITTALGAGKSLEEVAETMLEPLYEKLGRSFDLDAVIATITTPYQSYAEESNIYYPEFLEFLKSQSVGNTGRVTALDGTSAVFYEKIEMFADEAAFDTDRTSILQKLYYPDFEVWLQEQSSGYKVSKTFGAQTFYRPSKIV